MAATLEILTSPALDGVRHGFLTRKGGASSGVFKGLNCGPGSSDLAEVVAINRTRVAEAFDVDPAQLVGVHQTHSADVVHVTGPLAAPVEADAMVTDVPGVLLSVLTADCQPVLFADREAGVVGAAHAGWRGALDDILENTVAAMVKLGARREKIAAVIGPCISQRVYEVGWDFMDRFTDEDPEFARFFTQGPGERPIFDLPSFGLHKLREAGVGRAEWVHHCTYCEPELFYSYRRATHEQEVDYGRLISVIRL
ncbi:peptidoglycan editing factor PgeF [Pseudothioclava arenosa]|uniref:Purine nucleoside phosphorylase n=1 Tax=Pseudothioclava arenosa TaxID=1795308 RepID=A0A2A4CRC5_9RHOB|nr:peptidoglycan editing factor PgeF [Pseudothioclava arenosa]PCD77037.1 polyphenol oxidase [Pseudothioclava arenosa]